MLKDMQICILEQPAACAVLLDALMVVVGCVQCMHPVVHWLQEQSMHTTARS